MFDARRQIGMIQKRQFSHEARRTFLLHVFLTRTKCRMSNVFVEPRPKGLDGSPITDFVVEDHADHVLATFKTQEEAIHWARTHGHTPHVARVPHLNQKKKPDHWRPV